MLILKITCEEMGSLFIRCREENKYQKRMTALVAELRRRPTVPSVLATDLVSLAEAFGRV